MIQPANSMWPVQVTNEKKKKMLTTVNLINEAMARRTNAQARKWLILI